MYEKYYNHFTTVSLNAWKIIWNFYFTAFSGVFLDDIFAEFCFIILNILKYFF